MIKRRKPRVVILGGGFGGLATAKALGLGKEGDGKVIKFTEFQSFLKTFYPKKEEKEVDV